MDHDYNLKDLSPDDIYELLPYVVRAQDPGIIHTFFKALSEQHNFLVGRLREMPRSQDPTKTGRFTPEGLGEDSVLFQEWLVLKRLPSRSSTQELRVQALALLVPASIAAFTREQMLLRLLAGVVGETLESGLPDFALRPLLATAIQRHHIKGGSVSFELLGRILGVFELKVSELWTRFSIRNPSDPTDPANDGDFSPNPDQYPYWPRADKYGGPDDRQWPQGSEGYDPFVLDDDGTATITFDQLVVNRRSSRYYLAVVNDKNPFVNFLGEVMVKLQPGTYTLVGGTDSKRAQVSLPYRDGSGSVSLQAITTGNYGNQISVTVLNEASGAQKMIVDGPKSKIKFKSSVFDLVFGVDANTFYSLLPAIPVERVEDATPLDVPTDRTPPDYPVTGTVVGSRIKSDPTLHYQMDLDGFNDAMTVLRNLVEELRPLTRTIRRKSLGLVLSSFVRYAPSCALLSVVLQSSDGSFWKLQVSQGVISWIATEEAATTVPIQFDHGIGQWFQWSYSPSGFVTLPLTQGFNSNLSESIVFLRDGGGFVYLEDGALKNAGTYSRITDTIHGDGTPDEEFLAPGYNEVSDKPTADSAQYMSGDAVYVGAVPPCLLFQTVPEDDLQPIRSLADPDKFHVGAHFGTELRTDGDLSMNWHYDANGEMVGADLRTRHAGINTDVIEPVPTGDEIAEDGLSYGYPIQFLDYHGKYITRDRVTNAPVYYEYTEDSPNADTGGTLLAPVSLASMDGPVEGGEVPAGWVDEDSIDAGQWDPYTTDAWRRWRFMEFVPTGVPTGLSNASGKLRIDGIDGSGFAMGSTVLLEGTSYVPYNGAHPVIAVSTTSVTLGVNYSSAATGGVVWHRQELVKPEGLEAFKLTLRGDPGAAPGLSCTWRLWRSLSGVPEIMDTGTLSPGATLANSYGFAADFIWIETTGLLGGSGEFEFEEMPTLVRTGVLAAKGNERDTLQIIITNPGEYWWQYGQGGADPNSLDPLLGGEKWWRGGNFRSEWAGAYIGRGTNIPDELILSEAS